MNSATLPSFWEGYCKLDQNTRARAKKAYLLWAENPFHTSLRFKCINREESIWSVRVTMGYRALGILEQDTVTWFWIGNHDEYERFFG
ncbi:MAG: hypothetical protein K2P57_09035 [Burkholderiales bacterium]|nr:hypothetical protein [Burkholderiales bacterium]